MEPLDIATPMGVLITAAMFFEGHASARREAPLRDLPRAYASVLQPGKKWTTSVLPDPPGWGTTVVAMALLLLNVLLFIGGWSFDDFTWSVSSALLEAFVVAHTVVFLSGLRSRRDARAAQSLASEEVRRESTVALCPAFMPDSGHGDLRGLSQHLPRR